MDHHEQAITAHDRAYGQVDSEDARQWLLSAQVHATLAVADELAELRKSLGRPMTLGAEQHVDALKAWHKGRADR
jgi:hypothetical protein